MTDRLDLRDTTDREYRERLSDGTLGTIDVRDLRPQRRHEALLEIFDALGAGEGFVLVSDHDPKPLYHQFEAEAGLAFTWTYRKREPVEFRVLIGTAETNWGGPYHSRRSP